MNRTNLQFYTLVRTGTVLSTRSIASVIPRYNKPCRYSLKGTRCQCIKNNPPVVSPKNNEYGIRRGYYGGGEFTLITRRNSSGPVKPDSRQTPGKVALG